MSWTSRVHGTRRRNSPALQRGDGHGPTIWTGRAPLPAISPTIHSSLGSADTLGCQPVTAREGSCGPKDSEARRACSCVGERIEARLWSRSVELTNLGGLTAGLVGETSFTMVRRAERPRLDAPRQPDPTAPTSLIAPGHLGPKPTHDLGDMIDLHVRARVDHSALVSSRHRERAP